MTVASVIEFGVAPSEGDWLLELLTGVLDALRKQESFATRILHVDVADPN